MLTEQCNSEDTNALILAGCGAQAVVTGDVACINAADGAKINARGCHGDVLRSNPTWPGSLPTPVAKTPMRPPALLH